MRFCVSPLTQEQRTCLRDMQEEVLGQGKPKAAASSLEEADAEEELGAWLESIGVNSAWKLAPTLVAAGWRRHDIECAQEAFPSETLQDALNWLEALISAMQQLTTIEESISRVTDLVIAVKKYAYEDKNGEHLVDVHESIQSTLLILGHKFRYKQLTVEKDFAADLPKLKTRGTGLSQVWTNLLDNATDAAPEDRKCGFGRGRRTARCARASRTRAEGLRRRFGSRSSSRSTPPSRRAWERGWGWTSRSGS